MTLQKTDHLIAALADDLRPIKPMRRSRGLLLVALAALTTVGAVLLLSGLAPALAHGHISANQALANGLLLMLGASATAATIAMAFPRVGSRYDGPKWAIAMAAIFPIASVLLLVQASDPASLIGARHGIRCALAGSAAAALIGGVLLFWLRRGAPVSLTRAGVFLGVGAGALGSAIYGLSCPLDDLQHLGIWHFLPVAVCALIGAFAVPRLVKW